MLTSEYPDQPIVLSESTTTTASIPTVPAQQPLTPQEIERICKAFIRLLVATERGVKNDVK